MSGKLKVVRKMKAEKNFIKFSGEILDFKEV